MRAMMSSVSDSLIEVETKWDAKAPMMMGIV